MKFLLSLLLAQTSVQTMEETTEIREELRKTKELHDKKQTNYRDSLKRLSPREQLLEIVSYQTGKSHFHNTHFATNSKIDVLQVVESFLLPQETFQMMRTNTKFANRLKITGKLNLFPNESSVQTFRDLEFFAPKKEITWEDPDHLVSDDRKTNIEKCLRLTENKRSSCLIDEVYDWYPDVKLYPFFKGILSDVFKASDLETGNRARKVLLADAIRLNVPKDVAEWVVKRKMNLDESIITYTYTDSALGLTPLTLAVNYYSSERGLEIIKILLDAGADVNGGTKDPFVGSPSEGLTPLMFAAQNARNGDGNILVEYLFARGAEVNARNKEGYTALIHAGRSFETTNSLLVRGAEVNAETNCGYTALMHAASYDNVEAVKILLAAGAKLNIQYGGGQYSALMSAAFHGGPAIKLLLAAGANRELTDNRGRTAAQIAEAEGHLECADLIRNFKHDPFN